MKTKYYLFILGLFLVLTGTSLFAQNTTCPVPTATVTTVISTNSANLSWAASSATGYYKVQYRPIGISSVTWTQLYAQTNSYTLTGLTCATGYEWQVQSICSNVAGTATSSAFSPSLVFNTLTCTSVCPVPSGLAASSITAASAQLSWTSVTPAPAYFTLQYRPVNTPTWISVSVQGASTYLLTQLTCNTAYEWQVKAICANSGASGTVSAFSASSTFTTAACAAVCITPVGLSNNSITTTSAVLSWLAPVGTVYYKVQYRPLSPANSNWVQVTVTSGPLLTLTNLVCGTAYEWQVQSICGNAAGSSASSAFSPSLIFTTLACTSTCAVPTGMSTSGISASGAIASWTAVVGVGSYRIQYRLVSLAASTWTQQTVQGNSFTLSNLVCATGYEWQVQSICAANGISTTSAFSASSTFTTAACTIVCPVPTALLSGSITATSAQLSWTSTSPAPAYFTIQYRPLNTLNWISVSVQGASTYLLTQLTCNTTYEWQVKAICANSGTSGTASAFSASSTFTTAACTAACATPVGLSSNSITTTSAILSWLAPVGAVYYKIQYRPLSPANSNWVQVTVTSGPLFSLTNLVCGKAYEWQVQSICSTTPGSINSSPFSPSSNFTTLACTAVCTTPSGASTSGIMPSSATLNWTGVLGVSVYQLQYRLVTNVLTNWTQTTVQGTTFTLSNLICNAMYEWQVASVCSTLNGVASVSAFTPSVVFNTAACTTTCPVPSGLTSGNVTANTAYVGWTPVAGVISYTIQYRTILPNVPPTNPWTQVTVQVNTSTLTGLLCNTNYEWQVRSNCSSAVSGVSSFSPSSYFITAACTSICAAPVGLYVTSITPSSALLKWSLNSNFLTGNYNIRYRKLNTQNWIQTTSTTNSKLLSGLAYHSYYEWQVQKLCPASSGSTTGVWSAWSTSAYFHTHLMVSTSPNPANRMVKVEVLTDENTDELTRFELRNLLGTLVYQSDEKLINGSNQFEIPTANMTEGIYFLSVYNASSKTVTKIYVKH